MATVIKAGNATTGASITPDATGTLDFKTGTGAGATAFSIDASQVVTFPGTVSITGTFSPTNISTSGTLASGAATITGNSTVTGNLNVTGTLTAGGVTVPTILPITASVAANALTVTLNATAISFRSSTLGSGTVNTRTVSSPISVVVSSGSTLGTVSGQQSRIIVLAIDNAGTVELAVVNLAGGNNLDETTLISTTAEGGAGGADSATTIYSTTARSNVPFRVVGYVESTQATAGTWATAPSTIQGAGGNAVTAMSSVGYGQTYQVVTRNNGTTYYNTTGKPIYLVCIPINTGTWQLTVNSLALQSCNATAFIAYTFIIPANASYKLDFTAPQTQYELR
jgi:hypothetical protein